MTDEERFLKAEEAATRLAESLTRLKEEMGSYREAAGRLDGAVAAVSGLSDQVVNVAQSAQQGLDAIRSAGGPELLTRIDAARQDIGHVQSDMNRQLEPLPSMGGGIAQLDQAVRIVDQGIHSLSAQLGVLDETVHKADQEIHDVQDQAASLSGSLGVASKNIRTILWLTIAALAISTAAVVLAILARLP
jgi:methyl-accepting chemotaxis protein